LAVKSKEARLDEIKAKAVEEIAKLTSSFKISQEQID
jgi:hypothetical protein